MGLKASTRRRWIGAGFLLSALAMLLAGETLLKERLSPVVFLLYWLLCLGCTGAALCLAFLDLRAVGQRAREQQRELFDATLEDIQRQARDRAGQRTRVGEKIQPPNDDLD